MLLALTNHNRGNISGGLAVLGNFVGIIFDRLNVDGIIQGNFIVNGVLAILSAKRTFAMTVDTAETGLETEYGVLNFVLKFLKTGKDGVAGC